jgi:hypothetical protein
MPSNWAKTGEEYDAFMNSPPPPVPGSELVYDPNRVKIEADIGGSRRCLHCHRRLKRTKRKKNSNK